MLGAGLAMVELPELALGALPAPVAPAANLVSPKWVSASYWPNL